MIFYKVLVLFLESTRIVFHAWLFKKRIALLQHLSYQSVSNALECVSRTTM